MSTSPVQSPFGVPVPQDRPLRIVFMGTPEFAVPTLRALIDGPHDVIAVYTQPDRPRGRGRKVIPSPIKAVALEHEIPVFQPERMTSKEAVQQFRSENCDLAVVVAYGKILRQRVLDVPPLGCINGHASLLPYYRGAAPIFWAMANGETESGITTMQMDAGMDTGPMLVRKSISIGPNEDVGSFHDRLSALSAECMTETLERLVAGTLTQTEQEHDLATHARMIEKKDHWVNLEGSAQDAHNWIRASDPFPGSRVGLPNGKIMKLFGSRGIREDLQGTPGELVEVAADSICIACGEGAVELSEIQMPGKKRVSVKQYLAGNKFELGTVFTGNPKPQTDSKS